MDEAGNRAPREERADRTACTSSSSSSDDQASFQQPGDGACRAVGRTLDREVGEYYFESDHVSLKGNDDYRALLRTIAVLQAQKAKAVQDMDTLARIQKEALENPIAFVEKLQSKEDLHLPAPQRVVELPHIEWEKYSRTVDPDSFAHRHMTRQKRPAASVAPPGTSLEGAAEESEATAVIRGRVCNTGKPQTFNQLWTVEEQKRLEDLLLRFPPEEVEARRWEKIAKALGNRTPQQVASRIQKYFIKLTKAGLPVPGRVPSLSNYNRRPGAMRHHRYNRYLFQQSTFLASHDPPVFMSDYDEDGSGLARSASGSLDDGSGGSWSYDQDHNQHRQQQHSVDEAIPRELRNTAEYEELLYLKQLKSLKSEVAPIRPQRSIFKCVGCGAEPIVGTRWHCVQCPDSDNINFCSDCCDSQLAVGGHEANHELEGIGSADQHHQSDIDDDYAQFSQGDYNYLDPNYMPAS